jgi:hypothetical protein
MKVGRRAAAMGVAALAVARGARADAALESLLGRIARARAGVHTLRGPFTQTRTIGLLATDVHSTGSFALIRPDRLRWELDPPDAVTFWMGPDGLAYRDSHGEARLPSSSGRLAGALEDVRTLLGGDLANLAKRWDLRVVRDDSSGCEIEGTARAGEASLLRSIRFALTPDLVRPARAQLVESQRDRTSIDFGTVAGDTPIDPALVRPPG